MYILYNGVGAKVGNIHTKKEFMNIINENYIDSTWDIYIPEIESVVLYSVDYKGWSLPNDFVLFSFDDWLEYTEASIVD